MPCDFGRVFVSIYRGEEVVQLTMAGRGRRTVGIGREELVSVLDRVCVMLVGAVVLPSLRMLLVLVRMAVHRDGRRRGEEAEEAKSQDATSRSLQAPVCPTRCRVAVTL